MKSHSIPSVSIIITTRDRFSILCVTLKALAVQTYASRAIEAIVADAGISSEEEKIAGMRPAVPYSLVYLHCPRLSISAARNLAVQKARGEYLIIIDDDVFPVPTFVEAHLLTHQRYPRSIVQGELLPSPGTALLDQVRLLDLAEHRRNEMAGTNHCNVHSFNVSCLKEYVLKEPFDEAIDQYGWEDVEWGYRLIAKEKLRFRYSRDALAFHYKPKQTFQGVAAENFSASKGILYFVNRHPDLFLHQDPCAVKMYANSLVRALRDFSPLSPRALARKRQVISLHEKEAELFGVNEVREDICKAYHEIEFYSLCEGAWSRLYDLPVKQSIWCSEASDLSSCLVSWPVSLRYSGPDQAWSEEIARSYFELLVPFCWSKEESPLELHVFPCRPQEKQEAPYAAALCMLSLWEGPPVSLGGYREIWAVSQFDRDILSELNIPNISVLPPPVSWGSCQRALLSQEIHLPEAYVFVADAGYSTHLRGIKMLLEAFANAFSHREKAALVVAYPESQQIFVRQLLEEANALASSGGKTPPLVLVYPYQSSYDRQKITACGDCAVYAGAGESYVPFLAEAAAMGKGILATSFGGHCDFLGQSEAFLFPCEIVREDWRPAARVNRETLSDAFQHVYRHQIELKIKGQNAKRVLGQTRSHRKMRKAAFIRISETIRSFSPHEMAAFFVHD